MAEVVSIYEYSRLRATLDDLAHAAREFSTAAEYTVEEAIEQDFIDALAVAEAILDRVAFRRERTDG